MTTFQKVIKYLAIVFAVLLAVSIIGGILGAIGLFGGLFGSGVAAETTAYPVSPSVRELKLEIGAARLTVTEGDTLTVESDLKDLSVTEENGCLIIRQPKKVFTLSNKVGDLTITLPAEFHFEKADIVTGAGSVSVDTLSADRLSLELGAGEVVIDSLHAAEQATIDGGAGALTIGGGTVHDLDLNMGVGELNLTAALKGDSELDCGVGEANITLLGTREEYRIEVDKGLGSATVDGADVKDGTVIGSGTHEVEINCGVGAVTVDFR